MQKSHLNYKSTLMCIVATILFSACSTPAAIPTQNTQESSSIIATPKTVSTPEKVSTPRAVSTDEANVSSERPLRLSLPEAPVTVDPQQLSYTDEIAFAYLAYQPLMSFNLAMEPIPGAAESYKVSEDGKMYTFTLRPNLRYSDGTPLTAVDYAFGWKRLADPILAGGYQFIGCDLIVGFSAYAVTTCPDAEGNTKDITETQELDLVTLREQVGVRVVNERTLQIELTKPAPYFLSIAALWVGAPTRAKDVSHKEWWRASQTFVGNGPFALESWEDTIIRWKRNPYYVGPLGSVQIAALEYYLVGEPSTAIAAYKNDEIDIVQVGSANTTALASDPATAPQLYIGAPSTAVYLAFDLTTTPFNDRRVRQAFAQTINREVLVRDILQGVGKPAYSFIPEGIPGSVQTKMWSYNPAGARTLLMDAGYPNGDNFPNITLPFVAGGKNALLFEWLAYQLQQELGITIELMPLEQTAYAAWIDEAEQKPPLYLAAWTPDFPDPQNYYSTVFRTGGYTAGAIGYSNTKFDELVDIADREPSQDQRLAIYHQAEEVLLEDSPVVFLWHQQSSYLIQPRVQGVTTQVFTPIDPLGLPGFFNLSEIKIIQAAQK